MARRTISALVVAIVAVAAQAQAFGRFGYSETVDIPTFTVTKDGFRIKHDRADMFRFAEPAKRWRALLTSDLSQTVSLGAQEGNPEKARFDLLGAGFSLYFRSGMSLRLSSTAGPYITWHEGSAGPGVPTPKVDWLLISFRDSQPPVLLTLQGAKAAFQVKGRSGDWRLESEEPLAAWVRVVAPSGLLPQATNSAAALGELKGRVQKNLKYFLGPVPKLVDLKLESDETGVSATWEFDRPYAIVPMAASLAALGGYPLRMSSSTIRIDSSDPDGPVSVLTDTQMSIRFPVRRVPTGRALTLGMPSIPPTGTISPLDVEGVSELALLNLLALRDDLARETADETLTKYLGEANYTTEPHTNQRLPFGENGEGIDLAAAQALLMQSTISTVKATSEPNSLLTSVRWRRDWRTWQIWTPDSAVSLRAGSLAALAAALCPEPMRRLDAAMLEAGLAARKGLQVWRTRTGFTPGPEPEFGPLGGLRRAIFTYRSKTPEDDAFLGAVMSEIRVYGDRQVWAETKNGAIHLRWQAEDTKPMSIILASAYPLTATPTENLAQAFAEDALGFTVIRATAKERGLCEIRIGAPDWAGQIPKFVDPPRFREALAKG